MWSDERACSIKEGIARTGRVSGGLSVLLSIGIQRRQASRRTNSTIQRKSR